MVSISQFLALLYITRVYFQLSFPLISKIEPPRPLILRTSAKALRRSTRYRGIVRTIYVTDGISEILSRWSTEYRYCSGWYRRSRGAQLFPSTLFPQVLMDVSRILSMKPLSVGGPTCIHPRVHVTIARSRYI